MILTRDERILSDPGAQFIVVDYADSAIVVRLRLYARYEDFFTLKWDLNAGLSHFLMKTISRYHFHSVLCIILEQITKLNQRNNLP